MGGWRSGLCPAVRSSRRRRRGGEAAAGGSVRRIRYAFVETPRLRGSDRTRPGLVVVEANVNVKGIVMSTKVISNGTGDEALAFLAEKEARHTIASGRREPSRLNRAFIFSTRSAATLVEESTSLGPTNSVWGKLDYLLVKVTSGKALKTVSAKVSLSPASLGFTERTLDAAFRSHFVNNFGHSGVLQSDGKLAIIAQMTGANGRNATVKTVWELREGAWHLVTAQPD